MILKIQAFMLLKAALNYFPRRERMVIPVHHAMVMVA